MMLTDKVYSDIKSKILSLSLKPGTPLSFSALSQQYNVSISPIRDALKSLSSEGLVTIKPQSGTSVSLIDMDRVRDERFTRLYLELGTIEALGKNGISDNLIASWRDLLSQQEAAFARRDTVMFMELDYKMHGLLFTESRHQRVFEQIRNSCGNYHRLRMLSFLFDQCVQSALSQHRLLLQALEERDSEKLLEIDRTHISKIEYETADFQAAYPQYFKFS